MLARIFRGIVRHESRLRLRAITINSAAQNPMESSIRDKLTTHFSPNHLEIFNESYMHNVPKGSETHFKVVVVSDKFESTSLLQVHIHSNTLKLRTKNCN